MHRFIYTKKNINDVKLKVFLVFEDCDINKLLKKFNLNNISHIDDNFSKKKMELLGFYDKQQILVIGLGKKNEITIEDLVKLNSLIKPYLKNGKIDSIMYYIDSFDSKNRTKLDFIKDVIQNINNIHYKFTKYKKPNKSLPKTKNNKKSPKKITKKGYKGGNKETKIYLYVDEEKNTLKELKKFFILIDSINLVKDLGNEPPNILNPIEYIRRVRELFKPFDKNIKLKVLGEKLLKNMGFNSLLSVSNGSKFPGFLVEINLLGNSKKEKVGLVGKGITFDSGGLSIKIGKGMNGMKTDMLGSADVLGIMLYLARTNNKSNVSGYLAIAENMPDNQATRPGDVVTSYSGKTIEILNTDAEGRLVMADAFTYAQERGAKTIIDLATLTGQQASIGCELFGSIISTNNELKEKLISLGEKTNEKIVELPLYQEYINKTESEIADVKNDNFNCSASTIMAGAFLSNFINEDVKWAHLDMVGPARMGKNISGYGVRLISNYFE